MFKPSSASTSTSSSPSSTMVVRVLTYLSSRLQIQQKKKKHPPHIPDEIIFEILTRLPAKSVMKFRRVCKKWLHLTSSPYFIETHCRRAAPILLAQYDYGIHRPRPPDRVRMNLCVIDNHTVKRVVNGPVAAKINRGDLPILVASCDGLLVLELYTFDHLPSIFVNPVVLNNTLHWMASCTYCQILQYRHHATARPCKTPIITFDMVSEKFCSNPYPCEVDTCPGKKLHETIYLMNINGQLTLCSISVGFIDLWVLEDYEKWSWVRKHRSQLEWDVDKYPFRFRNFDPTYFNSRAKRPAVGDNGLLVKWLLKGLTLYQLDDEMVKKLEDEADDSRALININSCCMISYKPTFVSLRGGIITQRQ